MTVSALDRRTVLVGGLAAAAAGCARPQTVSPKMVIDWVQVSALPFPLQEIYPVWHDGAVWLAGGFRATETGPRASAVTLEQSGNNWREVPAASLGTGMHHVHLASAGGKLWAIGGYDGGADGRAWIGQTRIRILEVDGWRDGPALPKPIGEAVPLTLDERIHLIGGRSAIGLANATWGDQADVADHFVLQPGAARWETAAPLPLARNSAAGGALNHKLHIVSGRTLADGPTPAHHVYDPKTDRWTDAEPYPDPQGGLAAAVLAGRLYACGGETFTPPPGRVSNQCYSLAPNGAWRAETPLLTPRHGHGLVSTAAYPTLYAIGGAAGVGARDALDSVEASLHPVR
jgi:hypothetical protein